MDKRDYVVVPFGSGIVCSSSLMDATEKEEHPKN
jgi:hypothetical protein